MKQDKALIIIGNELKIDELENYHNTFEIDKNQLISLFQTKLSLEKVNMLIVKLETNNYIRCNDSFFTDSNLLYFTKDAFDRYKRIKKQKHGFISFIIMSFIEVSREVYFS